MTRPEPATIPISADAAFSLISELESEIGAGPGTNFFVDDLALVPTCAP